MGWVPELASSAEAWVQETGGKEIQIGLVGHEISKNMHDPHKLQDF